VAGDEEARKSRVEKRGSRRVGRSDFECKEGIDLGASVVGCKERMKLVDDEDRNGRIGRGSSGCIIPALSKES
jgi:hypothetical protein